MNQHHQPYRRPVFIQRGWCCVYSRTGRESPIYEFLQENQTTGSNKYCSQLDQLKAALDEKRPKLVNRKCINFISITQDWMLLWWSGKNCYAWLGSFDSSAVLTRHCTIRILIWFSLCKILLMEKTQFPGRLYKAPRTVLCIKNKKFWGCGIMKLPEKNGRK